ncbi:MAG: tetratricopeptide repeat protein [bacterium]|nr:tetratricopeptide repeat protein [bacterium]
MATISEAKEKALQLEKNGRFEDAIKIYMKIIAASKGNPDPSIYNKIGDIYINNLKKKSEAIENYKMAMNIYVQQTWFPLAIAMAKKILKLDPEQLEMYETVADLQKKAGSIGEALNSYILFAEKAIQQKNIQMAIEGFKKTLELVPEKVEIKEKLVDLYIQENNLEFALEYLKDIESFYLKRGDLPLASMTRKRISQIESKLGIKKEKPEEPVKESPKFEEKKKEVVEENLEFDLNELAEDLTKQLDETFSGDIFEAKTEEKVEEQNVVEGTVEDISSIFKEDASSIESYIELGKLQEDLDVKSAIEYYFQGAEAYYNAGNLKKALEVYIRIFELDKEQKLAAERIIDLSNKTGDFKGAIMVYLYFANKIKGESKEKAKQYIDTVLKVDPTNREALALKDEIEKGSEFFQKPVFEKPKKPVEKTKEVVKETTAKPKEEKVDDFLSSFKEELVKESENIDFFKESENITAADIVKGKNEGGKPMFKVEEGGKEAKDESFWSLQELLDELKEGLDQNISEEDVSSHYDLGLSFKEMGLYDMAIEEFQKSVKNKDFEMKSLEMLGQCFLEKGELDLAEESLIKALSMKGKAEIEYLGIKYTLAKLYEQKNMFKEALKLYNEIYAVDSKFEDVEKRINALKNITKQIEKPKVEVSNKSDKKEDKNEFIDFSTILKQEIGEDFNLDDFNVDEFNIDIDDNKSDNSKNNKISYM